MTDLFHTRNGRGRPMLVIHGGLGLDHTSMRSLDRLGDVAELIYVDVRGNGRSRAHGEDPTLEAMADDFDTLRAELGLERWTVFGHSYGAILALAYAIRHPSRVDALVAVGGAPNFHHAPMLAGNIARRPHPEAAALLGAMLGQPARDDAHFGEVWMGILPLYFHRWDPAYAAAFAETRWSGDGYNQGTPLLGTFDLSADLPSITARTLVISGDDDFIMPAEVCGAAVAAAIPGATHVVIPDTGHYPFLENPAAFDAAVRAWL